MTKANVLLHNRIVFLRELNVASKTSLERIKSLQCDLAVVGKFYTVVLPHQTDLVSVTHVND